MTKEEPQKTGQILKNSIYSGMDQQVFDISWSEAVKAYHEGNLFTREDWNTFVDIFDPLSEHDYSSIDYEEIINPVARGES